jgi:hypothetical protein
MRPWIARLFFFGALAFMNDGLVHQYVWPREIIQPVGGVRIILALGTHSREGNDYWMMILCFFLAFLIWQREKSSRDNR